MFRFFCAFLVITPTFAHGINRPKIVEQCYEKRGTDDQMVEFCITEQELAHIGINEIYELDTPYYFAPSLNFCKRIYLEDLVEQYNCARKELYASGDFMKYLQTRPDYKDLMPTFQTCFTNNNEIMSISMECFLKEIEG